MSLKYTYIALIIYRQACSSHHPICYCGFVSDSDSIFQVRCEAHFVFRNISCWGIVDWMRTKHCHDHNESILIGYNRVPNCPVFQGSCVPCLLCIMFLLCTIAFKCVPCSPGKKLSPPCVAVEDQPGNRRASLTLSQSSSNRASLPLTLSSSVHKQ